MTYRELMAKAHDAAVRLSDATGFKEVDLLDLLGVAYREGYYLALAEIGPEARRIVEIIKESTP